MKKHIKKHPFLFAEAVLFILSVILYIAERLSVSFAEHINSGFAAFMRKALAFITAPFPFSLFEIICIAALILAIIIIISGIIYIIKRIRKKAFRFPLGKCSLALLIALLTVFELFTLTLAPSYNCISVADKMGLDLNVSGDDIFAACEFLIDQMENDLKLIKKTENGESICGSDLKDTEKKIEEACNEFAKKYPFYKNGSGTAKGLILSKPLTYTFITGSYGFFTGESNINTNFPKLILAPTVAHEFSHARGIAPENECNFLAFAVCLSSSDPYIRYAGASFVFDRIAATCKKTDLERYKELYAKIPDTVIKDYIAYSRYIDAYKTPVAEISNGINSAYLKSQGQKKGTVSYSLTVEITASYIRDMINKA